MKTLEQMGVDAKMQRVGDGIWYANSDDLLRFAALVAEQCAELVRATVEQDPDSRFNDSWHWLEKAADAVMARFPKP